MSAFHFWTSFFFTQECTCMSSQGGLLKVLSSWHNHLPECTKMHFSRLQIVTISHTLSSYAQEPHERHLHVFINSSVSYSILFTFYFKIWGEPCVSNIDDTHCFSPCQQWGTLPQSIVCPGTQLIHHVVVGHLGPGKSFVIETATVLKIKCNLKEIQVSNIF